MIRRAKWLQQVDWTWINDLVLLSLFQMGILDWTGLNDRLHQATQAIWHLTAMHLCILPRIMKLESRVRETDTGLFNNPNLFFSRSMTQREWNTHGIQICCIEADAEKSHQEILLTTNRIEAIIENNCIFSRKWELTHDWIDHCSEEYCFLQAHMVDLESLSGLQQTAL